MKDINKRRNAANTSKPLTTLLGTEDRERLELISDTWNVSLAEAIRRAITNEAERVEEEKSAPRLNQIQESQTKTQEVISRLSMDLSEHRARTESLIAIVRSMENQLRIEIESVATSTNSTAVRLLAMVRTLKTRDAIEAEIQRILHGD
jgi:hypothetical protein